MQVDLSGGSANMVKRTCISCTVITVACKGHSSAVLPSQPGVHVRPWHEFLAWIAHCGCQQRSSNRQKVHPWDVAPPCNAHFL